MLVVGGGRERTEAEYRELLAAIRRARRSAQNKSGAPLKTRRSKVPL